MIQKREGTSLLRRLASVVALALLGAAVPSSAQTAAEPDPTRVRIRIGPLWLNPSVSLTNLGVDDNVFNEPDDALPKRDFTLTITPMTDLWFRVGPTWVTGNIKEDLVWYQKYASQRSGNNTYSIGWQVPLSRLVLTTKNSWTNTRERPGYEIDSRPHRTETSLSGSVEILAFSQTFIGVRGDRTVADFSEDAAFQGTSLRYELNRTSIAAGVTLRRQLTPLTDVTFKADRSQDRFEFNPARDSNSTSFTGSVNFAPAALIKGSASFGYRDFKPLSPDVPGYQGGTAAVDLTYTLSGSTRLTVSGVRNVQYSYDVNQPYYIQTGIGGSIDQQVFGPIDLLARIGRQRLAYRDRIGAVVPTVDRNDDVRTYGGGIGYHAGKDLRIGVNVDREKRESALLNRQYHSLKIGMAITYGI